VDDLCVKVQAVTKPCAVTRLGKENTTAGRPRLIKATFPSQFDARAFLSRMEESRKNANNDAQRIRVRPGRTPDEQSLFTKLSKQVYKMNQDAKSAGLNESFSVRATGDVWKFTKSESGRWVHSKDWVFTPTTLSSGNESGAPASPTRVHMVASTAATGDL
jgi:hypothetical protein